MALILKKLYLGYQYLNNDLADKRTADYILMSPVQMCLIIGAYLYFVKKWGPALMKNRKPFELKNILIIYNALQIIFNAALFYRATIIVSKMSWSCALIDYSQTSHAIFQINGIHSFYLLKIFDALDTVFFVLRKSTRQITFLHVYHHAGMIFATFVASKFLPGGEAIWTGYINLFVHMVMFTYYLLTAIDKRWKNATGFKKALTQIQIVQFVLNILIYGRLFFKPDCPYPKFVPFLYVPQNFFMLFLFSEFYIKSYMNKEKNMKVPNKL